MCYSALVISGWKRFVSQTGIKIDLREFAELEEKRYRETTEFKIPRRFDREFSEPQSDDERAFKALNEQYRREQTGKPEKETFAQRKRMADAERKLSEKPTKTAAEDKRIAGNKVQQALG